VPVLYDIERSRNALSKTLGKLAVLGSKHLFSFLGRKKKAVPKKKEVENPSGPIFCFE